MIKATFKALQKKWNSYKYRFVPWIAVNLGKNERTLRQVMDRTQDKLVSDEEISASLRTFFRALFKSSLQRQQEVLSVLPDSLRSTYQAFPYTIETQKSLDGHHDPSKVMLETMGFSIHRAPSSLQSAGTGVFISAGTVPQGATVAMYPGTVYYAHEPIFFQSIRNPFIFRCIDGVLVDGNDRGISKVVFRSCSGRDRLGPFQMSDTSWLTTIPQNPLAVGQYVNNCSNEKAANVCYQEFDVPAEFPLELCQFLPNVNYRHEVQRPLRCVVLVALREIHQGEELFSNYYTIVH
ncbi:SET domain-containing protein 9 isoform X1 [Lepisosteus oculatus]|uniref:SET domain containing 9 n=1 Tax=Lepisosteus oculatus TaxID=7918 RepID=W5ML98_LEPOC|nr:PREDICTED: SET domain-containing protein 9 isoform X1 [Lepisosteus oculatus]